MKNVHYIVFVHPEDGYAPEYCFPYAYHNPDVYDDYEDSFVDAKADYDKLAAVNDGIAIVSLAKYWEENGDWVHDTLYTTE